MRELLTGFVMLYVFMGDPKFLFGFTSGAYIGSHYDLKPYFDTAIVKIREQLIQLKNEINKELNKEINKETT